VGMWLVVTFLVLEARRYRCYDLWNRRVRLLEDGFWAPLLRELALELSRPQLQLSFASALATRMSRAYGSLLVLLMGTWLVKVYSHPRPAGDWNEFLERAHVGLMAGGPVFVSVALLALFFAGAFLLARLGRSPLGELQARPRQRRLAVGELLLRPYPLTPPRKPRARA